MDRSNVVTLVMQKFKQDNIGQMIATETMHNVFCNVRSVSRSEFFAAGQIGLTPDYELTMFLYDYDGEKIAVFENNRYAVYRTYRNDSDYITLYLQRETGVENG